MGRAPCPRRSSGAARRQRSPAWPRPAPDTRRAARCSRRRSDRGTAGTAARPGRATARAPRRARRERSCLCSSIRRTRTRSPGAARGTNVTRPSAPRPTASPPAASESTSSSISRGAWSVTPCPPRPRAARDAEPRVRAALAHRDLDRAARADVGAAARRARRSRRLAHRGDACPSMRKRVAAGSSPAMSVTRLPKRSTWTTRLSPGGTIEATAQLDRGPRRLRRLAVRQAGGDGREHVAAVERGGQRARAEAGSSIAWTASGRGATARRRRCRARRRGDADGDHHRGARAAHTGIDDDQVDGAGRKLRRGVEEHAGACATSSGGTRA